MNTKKKAKPSAVKRWNKVLGGFKAQGKPCKTFCRERNLIFNNVRAAVLGERTGPKDIEHKKLIMKASKSIKSVLTDLPEHLPPQGDVPPSPAADAQQ